MGMPPPPYAMRGLKESMKTAIELISEERQRQGSVEGYSNAHDDTLTDEELIDASLCYVAAATSLEHNLGDVTWPRGNKWIQTSGAGDDIRNLVKAAALIAAEIDRRQRASFKEAA